MRNCLDCGKPTNKANQAKYCSSCAKIRHRASVRKWNRNHPKHMKEAAHRYIKRHPDRIKKQNDKMAQYKRKRHLKRYNITPKDWENIFNEQGRVCAICKCEQPARAWNTDHDHQTGEVRGILCESCNVLLGNAKDNVTILLAAIDYLNRTGLGA